TGVQFVGRYTDLGAEAEHLAVGPGGGGVDHHGGGIDPGAERVGDLDAAGRDGLGVPGGPAGDVVEGLVHAVDHLDRDVHAQVLLAPVRVIGRDHALEVAVDGHPGRVERAHHTIDGGLAERGVQQDGLGGVADTAAAGLAVDREADRLVQVRVSVDVEVAVAGA